MKPEDIEVGGYYTDGTTAVRGVEVLSGGHHVIYRPYNTAHPEIQYKRHGMNLVQFAAWTKSRVDAPAAPREESPR